MYGYESQSFTAFVSTKDETETKAEDGTGDDEDVELPFENSPLWLVIVLVFLLVTCSAVNYWLAGRFSYMGSLKRVWTERSVEVYVTQITDQFSTSFRFAATIL